MDQDQTDTEGTLRGVHGATAGAASGRALGILGGMGPLASAELVWTLYRCHLSGAEQEAPACVLYSDPSVPDRTAAILAGEQEEITRRLAQALGTLVGMGAWRIVIACVTAHHFLPGVPEQLRRRVISLLDLVAGEVLARPGRHLLLTTTGTRQARIFEAHPRWPEISSQVVRPGEADQHALHAMLYRLKLCQPPGDSISWIEELGARYGAGRLIFGCTELHLLHRHLAGRLEDRIVDPLLIAARDARRLLAL